jgi:putative ABC transport system permease protein
MFTVVLSTGESLDNTIATSFSLGEDVAIKLDRPRRIDHVIDVAKAVSGVVDAEVWHNHPATLSLPASSEGSQANDEEHAVTLIGVPPDSAIFAPHIVSGRGLRPGDENALIFTLRLAEEQGVRVGDEITLNIRDAESQWTVVGLYLSVNDVSDEFFVPLDVLGQETGTYGRGRRIKLLSEADDIDSQQRLIQTLKDGFAAQHVEVVDAWSSSEQLRESQASFGLLTSLLLAMVVLTAIVGAIGLTNTMAINAVERTWEVGVMRAIGASSPTIVGMFVAEGVLVGALSWILALPLSYPGARVFSDLIGQVILDMPLQFVYSAGGMVLWLVIVVTLSALASLWPALQAARVSVRQALAYE